MFTLLNSSTQPPVQLMNFRFSTLDGAYQTHPQNPYQTQGGPQQQPQQQQQSNPSQSLQNSAPSTQPRLTPMAPPTAPPTPPTQQQQQPQGQQTPYAVSQGGAQVQRSASQYQRTATPNVRRPQVISTRFPLPPFSLILLLLFFSLLATAAIYLFTANFSIQYIRHSRQSYSASSSNLRSALSSATSLSSHPAILLSTSSELSANDTGHEWSASTGRRYLERTAQHAGPNQQ